MIDDDMSRYLAGRVIESLTEDRGAKKGAEMAHPPASTVEIRLQGFDEIANR